MVLSMHNLTHYAELVGFDPNDRYQRVTINEDASIIVSVADNDRKLYLKGAGTKTGMVGGFSRVSDLVTITSGRTGKTVRPSATVNPSTQTCYSGHPAKMGERLRGVSMSLPDDKWIYRPSIHHPNISTFESASCRGQFLGSGLVGGCRNGDAVDVMETDSPQLWNVHRSDTYDRIFATTMEGSCYDMAIAIKGDSAADGAELELSSVSYDPLIVGSPRDYFRLEFPAADDLAIRPNFHDCDGGSGNHILAMSTGTLNDRFRFLFRFRPVEQAFESMMCPGTVLTVVSGNGGYCVDGRDVRLFPMSEELQSQQRFRILREQNLIRLLECDYYLELRPYKGQGDGHPDLGIFSLRSNHDPKAVYQNITVVQDY